MKRATVELLLETLTLRSGLTAERAAKAWSAVDVRGLRQLIEYEGASVWLYRRLKKLKAPAPDALAADLRNAVHRTSISNMRIDAQTVAVTAMLSDASIPWALLKGQARRAAIGRYPFADARPVSDVDLLVPGPYAERAWHLLCERGFRQVIEGPTDWKVDHHYPTLIDANNVAVELHTTTCTSVTPSEAWRRATEGTDSVSWSGMETRVPNATELVWQALSHSVADGARGYSLKAFLSVAAILAAEPAIDWGSIATRMEHDEVIDNEMQRPVAPERVRRILMVAARLAGAQIPQTLAPRTRVDLVPLLMWRGWVLSAPLGRATRERLLEEGLRVEAMLPVTPFVPRVGVLRNLRRRISSLVARIAYRAWRATR